MKKLFLLLGLILTFTALNSYAMKRERGVKDNNEEKDFTTQPLVKKSKKEEQAEDRESNAEQFSYDHADDMDKDLTDNLEQGSEELSLNSIPDEIKLHILSFVFGPDNDSGRAFKDSKILRRVCSHFNSLILDPASNFVSSIIKQLIAFDKEKANKLYLLSLQYDNDLADLFIDLNMDVNIPIPRSDCNSLYHALQYARDTTVDKIIEKGATVDNRSAVFSLILANKLQKRDFVSKLLSYGTLDHAEVPLTNSPLLYALFLRNKTLIEILLSNGNSNASILAYTALMIALESGEEAISNLLLDKNTDISSQNGYQETALMLASDKGYASIVKQLIEKQPGLINTKDIFGQTALIHAVKQGHREIVNLLLVSDAQVNIQYIKGWTALIEAASKGHTEIVKLLLEAGAEVNLKNEQGATALVYAAISSHTEIVQLLFEYGADVNALDEVSMTALMYAARKGNTEMVKLLLDYRAKSNLQNNNGLTALSFAAHYGHLPTVQVLLTYGVDYINASEINGFTALLRATDQGYTEIAKLLLNYGADVNAQNERGETALMLAVYRGYTELVKLLLEAGARVDVQDTSGRTALAIAGENNHTEISKLLVENNN